MEGGGCSGFQYKFDLESGSLDEEDRSFERDGAKVVIDSTSLDYLNGSTVDYHTELIRSAFRIVDNPLAEQVSSVLALYVFIILILGKKLLFYKLLILSFLLPVQYYL